MLTAKTTFAEIMKIDALKPVIPYLIWNKEGSVNPKPDLNFEDVQKNNPTWNANDMVYGLQRLLEIANSGCDYIYDLYPDKEMEVKLIHFPAAGSEKYVILAAGGAYGAVCSLVEAFPVAAKLNQLGITAFCLNYRVGGTELFPKPMDDLAAACQYIREHAKAFGVNPDTYAVGGFSAGGHLAASWGTKELGFRKYQLSPPKLLLLNYPMLSVWRIVTNFPKPIQQIMLRGYLGEDYSKEKCRPYDIDENVDEKYPPVYLIHAEDDTTVPIWSSEEMVKELEKYQISYCYEHPDIGGHGYGLGSNSKADGWVERAVAFWQKLE